jgi:Cu-Zn family superoxide dismutase
MKKIFYLGMIPLISFASLLFTATASAEVGKASIKGTAEGSTLKGNAKFQEVPEGLKITVKVTNVPPGKHGLHIHQYGDCEDLGNAAGDHFNPDGVQHGLLLKDGFAAAHAGDLGNIEVGPDGTGELKVVIPGLSLSGGRYSFIGRSVILHEKEDNFGQPLGNAGARIGCGKIYIRPDTSKPKSELE